MPRRAWLLVTPTMLNELYEFIHHRELWTVIAHPLPEDVRFVRAVSVRGGAYRYLCESASFADVPEADAPELPQPVLIKTSALATIDPMGGPH